VSNVTLEIGGRSFSVASADGEEDHVVALGRKIDDKLRSMGGAAGQSESRMLLFAALLLADEVHEAQFRTPAAQAAPQAPALANGTAERLETLATRLENLAAALERGPTSA
jgi:cell division protein ZapA